MTGKMFAYGSLMTDFFNYKKIFKNNVIKKEEAYVLGRLYHLKNKGYPALILKGNSKVYGEILTIANYDKLIIEMDELEWNLDKENNEKEYNRIPLMITQVATKEVIELDTYVYNLKANRNHMDEKIFIKEGSWRKFMLERSEK